jgi:hypothetical protein
MINKCNMDSKSLTSKVLRGNIMKQTVFRVLVLCSLATSLLFASFPTQTAQARDECTARSNGSFLGFCVRILRISLARDGRLIVDFQGGQPFDRYNVRWSRPGIGETQREIGGRLTWWALANAWRNTVYTIKIQGCTSGFLGTKCTQWNVKTFRTPR